MINITGYSSTADWTATKQHYTNTQARIYGWIHAANYNTYVKTVDRFSVVAAVQNYKLWVTRIQKHSTNEHELPLKIWQFFITHTIYQTDIPLGYTHTFCQHVAPLQ
jgi:hypothetical protein